MSEPTETLRVGDCRACRARVAGLHGAHDALTCVCTEPCEGCETSPAERPDLPAAIAGLRRDQPSCDSHEPSVDSTDAAPGGNGEDCLACAGVDLPYPWICPGHASPGPAPAQATEPEPAETPAYAWAQTIHTTDAGHTIRIPGTHHSPAGDETREVLVRREDVPVLRDMLNSALAPTSPPTFPPPPPPGSPCAEHDVNEWACVAHPQTGELTHVERARPGLRVDFTGSSLHGARDPLATSKEQP